MPRKIQRAFTLSEQGAKDLIKGSVACVFRDLALMFSVGLLYYLVHDLLTGAASNGTFYVVEVLVCLALISIATYFQYNATFFATYVESGVRHISLAGELHKIPLSSFGKRNLADLTSTIIADYIYLKTSFSHYIPVLFGSIVSTAVVSLSLFAFDQRMALASLWVIPVSFLIVVFSVRVQGTLSQKQMDTKTACADGIQGCLESIRDLRSNNAGQDYLKGLDKEIGAVEEHAIVSELSTAVFIVAAQLVLKTGITIVALTGSVLLVDGILDVLTFFMFLLVASRLYNPFQTALQNFAAVLATRTHVARMNEILDRPMQSGSSEFHPDGHDIIFDHVIFAYSGEEDMLKDVSLTAKQGEVIALVGPSDEGKTAVSRLVVCFWDTGQGRITLGGKNVSQADPETLLPMYAIMFQGVALFNNTVMEDTRIGRCNATDEEVITAAEAAHCDEFASQMPRGYQTMIGKDGTALSDGERQRIPIARTLLKDAPIILLDEMTASLGIENETLIQSTISELVKNKAVLVVAHRMHTMAGADKIVVLSEGTAAGQGTPTELTKRNDIYRRIVQL